MRFSTLALSLFGALALAACSDGGSSNSSGGAASGAPTPASGSTASGSGAGGAPSGDAITGAGASFPQPVYAQWAQLFQKEAGKQVNYQSIGSSGGVKQIEANTVDFGASDAPLKPEDLEKKGLVQFPTVVGGVVPVVNIDGIKPGELTLSGEVLANIYLGKITKWSDPAIAALNKDVKLPDAAINTVFRSDGSGTTFNFTNYLSSVSAEWKEKVGASNSVKWPTSASGAAGKGNEGVSAFVSKVKNSIGYVEYAYAKQNNMSHTNLINKAGKKVEPSQESFAAAADTDWKSVPGFGLVLTNQAGEKAWPIASATFILVHKQPSDPARVKAALSFFDWAYKNGDDAAKKLDYVPLPASVKDLVREEWKKVVDKDGKPVLN